MNYAVYKYEILPGEHIDIDLPQGAEILTVQIQGDQPCIWAMIDTRAPIQRRRFRLAGTGHPISDPDALTYIGTFQLYEGALVYHLFEYARRINE